MQSELITQTPHTHAHTNKYTLTNCLLACYEFRHLFCHLAVKCSWANVEIYYPFPVVCH